MSPTTNALLEYLTQSPTPFHAVENAVSRLEKAGFRRLEEGDSWKVRPGKYFVTHNDSSLIAFHYGGKAADRGFRMVGAHTDSPCLKVKPNAINTSSGYARLAVEIYGGALLAPWFDRDLGLAGRVSYADKKGAIHSRLVKFDRAIGFVPSLAIHLDREVNDKRSINRQTEMPPLLCLAGKKAPNLSDLLIEQLKAQHRIRSIDRVLGFELCLYDLQPAAVVGLNEEFIASARLDNLLSCHAAVEAITSAKADGNPLIVLNDHEEVGSASTSGAEGPLLESVLLRLCGDEDTLRRALSHSMLVSADNAHGIHPNYTDRHEPDHQPMINSGPVIKINSNQRYATNSETEALFRQACDNAGLPVQCFVVRSDMGCGSTIGPITATGLGVRTVDIGVPQLGMHSIRELAGVKDQQTLVKALGAFFDFAPWPF